jgi:spore germination protein YaaH
MEDAASLKARLELMKNEGIKGIAALRLGRETPDVWPLIAEYNAQNR